MFKKKSRTEHASEAARHQVDVLREKAALGAGVAGGAAATAAANARDWAGPRLERARDLSVEKAAPRVESAARALGPKVDEVHDRIVDDVLPKVVAAVSAAADAAADRAHDVQKASHAQLDAVAKEAKKSKRSKGKGIGRFLLIFSTVAAAMGAGYFAWKRMSAPADDPWATASSSVRTSPATSATPPVKPAPVKPAGSTTTGSATTGAAATGASASAATTGAAEPVKKGGTTALPSENIEPLPPNTGKSGTTDAKDAVKDAAKDVKEAAQDAVDKAKEKLNEAKAGESHTAPKPGDAKPGDVKPGEVPPPKPGPAAGA